MIILKEYVAPEGFKVNLSTLGYYNFYYPSKVVGFINKETILEKISWTSYQDKAPFKVPTECLDTDSLQAPGRYSVIWINLDRIGMLRGRE
jgi:hypothetical protein